MDMQPPMWPMPRLPIASITALRTSLALALSLLSSSSSIPASPIGS